MTYGLFFDKQASLTYTENHASVWNQKMSSNRDFLNNDTFSYYYCRDSTPT